MHQRVQPGTAADISTVPAATASHPPCLLTAATASLLFSCLLLSLPPIQPCHITIPKSQMEVCLLKTFRGSHCSQENAQTPNHSLEGPSHSGLAPTFRDSRYPGSQDILGTHPLSGTRASPPLLCSSLKAPLAPQQVQNSTITPCLVGLCPHSAHVLARMGSPL